MWIMAKYECRFQGDYNDFLKFLDNEWVWCSISADIEDGSDYEKDGVRCAIRVYERYSIAGGNRVSLSIMVVGAGEEIFVSAISAGGSQAIAIKINTLGEKSFLTAAVKRIEEYRSRTDK
jgi:hypothetical protein